MQADNDGIAETHVDEPGSFSLLSQGTKKQLNTWSECPKGLP